MAGRTLLVASPGGHIEELFELAPRIDCVGPDQLWVTAETPQTNRLLAHHETVWVPAVGPRQGGRAVASVPRAISLIRRYRPSRVLSTGAALAVPYLTAARIFGVESHYIESATRLKEPSLAGGMVARLPGVHLHHQGFQSPPPRWRRLGSVFDGFVPGDASDGRVRSAVVTLGTERFPFPRALEQLAPHLASLDSVLIQTGHTPPLNSTPPCREWVPSDELVGAVQSADLVITHAGVGSVLTALCAGKHPVIIPRLGNLREHVDDHQLELANFLVSRGLATVVMPGDDVGEIIHAAARRTTVRAGIESIRIGL